MFVVLQEFFNSNTLGHPANVIFTFFRVDNDLLLKFSVLSLFLGDLAKHF